MWIGLREREREREQGEEVGHSLVEEGCRGANRVSSDDGDDDHNDDAVRAEGIGKRERNEAK